MLISCSNNILPYTATNIATVFSDGYVRHNFPTLISNFVLSSEIKRNCLSSLKKRPPYEQVHVCKLLYPEILSKDQISCQVYAQRFYLKILT